MGDFIGPPLEDGTFGNEESFWDEASSSFWTFFYSDRGSDIWGNMMWNYNYKKAQQVLGLAILGYITYKTFK